MANACIEHFLRQFVDFRPQLLLCVGCGRRGVSEVVWIVQTECKLTAKVDYVGGRPDGVGCFWDCEMQFGGAALASPG